MNTLFVILFQWELPKKGCANFQNFAQCKTHVWRSAQKISWPSLRRLQSVLYYRSDDRHVAEIVLRSRVGSTRKFSRVWWGGIKTFRGVCTFDALSWNVFLFAGGSSNVQNPSETLCKRAYIHSSSARVPLRNQRRRVRTSELKVEPKFFLSSGPRGCKDGRARQGQTK